MIVSRGDEAGIGRVFRRCGKRVEEWWRVEDSRGEKRTFGEARRRVEERDDEVARRAVRSGRGRWWEISRRSSGGRRVSIFLLLVEGKRVNGRAEQDAGTGLGEGKLVGGFIDAGLREQMLDGRRKVGLIA